MPKARLYSDELAYDMLDRYLAVAFGWVNGKLYFGPTHNDITLDLVNQEGYDYETLMELPQAWGWARRNMAHSYVPTNGLDIHFASDKYYNQQYGDQSNIEKAKADLLYWYRSHLPQAFGSRSWT